MPTAKGRSGPRNRKLRAALVLHGKLGALTGARTRAVDNAQPTLDLIVMCFAAMVRNVIEPNRADYAVDIIGHSWNPGPIADTLDRVYLPVASAHEQEEIRRNNALCLDVATKLRSQATILNRSFTRFGFVGRGASSCVRTASHLLGIQRAIHLKARAEREGGFVYDVVMVSRWDVLWNRPVLLGGFDLSSDAYSLPRFCTPPHGRLETGDAVGKVKYENEQFRRDVCGGKATDGMVPTAAETCRGDHRPCWGDMSTEAREVLLLDWCVARSRPPLPPAGANTRARS